MNLLSICQDIAQEIGIDTPSSIVNNGEATAQRLLAAAQREGKSLFRRDWTALHMEYEFSTVASQDEYEFPAGFSRLLTDSVWDRTNYRKIRGGLSAQEWQHRKSAITAQNDIHRAYRIKAAAAGARVFVIDPVPSTVDALVFEYASNHWCESEAGVGQSEWLADTDVPRLDETLMGLGVRWRILQRLGLSYLDERDEYDRMVDIDLARDTGPQTLNMGRKRTRFFVNLPDTGYG